jgi:hypothetical protein
METMNINLLLTTRADTVMVQSEIRKSLKTKQQTRAPELWVHHRLLYACVFPPRHPRVVLCVYIRLYSL